MSDANEPTDFGKTWLKLMEAMDLLQECRERHQLLIEFENKRK